MLIIFVISEQLQKSTSPAPQSGEQTEQNTENPQEMVLPQVLEDVLNLKNQLSMEIGSDELASEAKTKDRSEKSSVWDENVVSKNLLFCSSTLKL